VNVLTRLASIIGLWIGIGLVAVAPIAEAAQEVSFPTTDGGEIYGLLRGDGPHAVVLAHGQIFDKESWDPLATLLAERGLRVLAIDFRGYGKSKGGPRQRAYVFDVIGAVRYLRSEGATRISLVGGSIGGSAVSTAASLRGVGDLARIVLLSPVTIDRPQQIRGSKLVVVSQEERRLVRRLLPLFARLREPKTWKEFPGSAHGQRLFDTEHGEELTELISAFLLDGAPAAAGGEATQPEPDAAP
jgi:pimeloyl-ACP methyl ester carboxylesterase